MNIVGSGKISDFICKKSGSANICGSGDIEVYQTLNVKIMKNCVGSGDIKIHNFGMAKKPKGYVVDKRKNGTNNNRKK